MLNNYVLIVSSQITKWMADKSWFNCDLEGFLGFELFFLVFDIDLDP